MKLSFFSNVSPDTELGLDITINGINLGDFPNALGCRIHSDGSCEIIVDINSDKIKVVGQAENTEDVEGIEWWRMPDHWKRAVAVEYAHSIGLRTRVKNGIHYVELKYVPAEFTIDDGAKYKGYHMPMVDWNGWKVPYFTKDVAQQVLDNYNKEQQHFRWKGGDTILFDDGEGYQQEYEGEMITVDGKQIFVYCLGLGWVWDIAEED